LGLPHRDRGIPWAGSVGLQSQASLRVPAGFLGPEKGGQARTVPSERFPDAREVGGGEDGKCTSKGRTHFHGGSGGLVRLKGDMTEKGLVWDRSNPAVARDSCYDCQKRGVFTLRKWK